MRSITETLTADGTLVERRYYLDGIEVDQVAFDATPDPPTLAEQVAELREEVRGIRERAQQAASSTTGGAATVANAVAGPRP